MGVANSPALDGRDDGHSRGELSLARLHAQDAGVGALERVENRRRRGPHGARGDRFDQQRGRHRPAVRQRLLDRGRDVTARLVGDQRDVLARLNAQTRLDRIGRARAQLV